jgi:hypothetical protein
MVAPAPIGHLARRLADYIRKERDRLLPFATPLLAEDRTVLEGFFEREFLDGVQVVVGVQVRKPAFLRELDRFGLPIPSVSLADALTLDCLIASNETLRLDTLVHELSMRSSTGTRNRCVRPPVCRRVPVLWLRADALGKGGNGVGRAVCPRREFPGRT